MDEESESIWSKLANINPLFFVMGLFLVAVLFSFWVWQTVHTPPVYPTPRFTHGTVISPVQVLTARARKALSPTPILETLTPQIVLTPDGTPRPWDG